MIPGELSFLSWLESLRSPFWNHFWEIVTLLGEDTVFIFVIAFIYFLYDKKLAYRICFLMATSLGINGILKNIFQIPRPFASGKISCVRPETATGYSFPSGHTQTVTTWNFLLADYFKKKWLFFVALLCALMVGFSRIFLGAHYVSDVMFALLFGILIAIFGNRVYNSVQNKHKLCLVTFLLFTPFFVWFLYVPDPHYEDFFKCYGLLFGFLLSIKLEETYANLNQAVSLAKRVCRMLFGVAIAILLKSVLSWICVSGTLRLSLLWDCFRYFLLVVFIFGCYPILLKKLNW